MGGHRTPERGAAILPSMIASALALWGARRFHRNSLRNWELAPSGDLLRQGTDKRTLTDLFPEVWLEPDLLSIPLVGTIMDPAQRTVTDHTSLAAAMAIFWRGGRLGLAGGRGSPFRGARAQVLPIRSPPS